MQIFSKSYGGLSWTKLVPICEQISVTIRALEINKAFEYEYTRLLVDTLVVNCTRLVEENKEVGKVENI